MGRIHKVVLKQGWGQMNGVKARSYGHDPQYKPNLPWLSFFHFVCLSDSMKEGFAYQHPYRAVHVFVHIRNMEEGLTAAIRGKRKTDSTTERGLKKRGVQHRK